MLTYPMVDLVVDQAERQDLCRRATVLDVDVVRAEDENVNGPTQAWEEMQSSKMNWLASLQCAYRPRLR